MELPAEPPAGRPVHSFDTSLHDIRPRLVRGVAVLAAGLSGFGLVLGVAAHWAQLGRAGQFGVLQVAALLAGAAAGFGPLRWRRPAGLLALFGIGALLAFFGQTYQTGADAWTLFALWALLALPLCLGLRSDLLWTPWALIGMTALTLWQHVHLGRRWAAQAADLPVHLQTWALAFALVVLLSPALRQRLGSGPWSLRLAVTLTVVQLSGTALLALFGPQLGLLYLLALLMLGTAALLLSRPRWCDLYALSAVALGLDTLLVSGLGRVLFDLERDLDLGALLLLGLVAVGLLAGSVRWVLRCAAAAGLLASGAARRPAPADGAARHVADAPDTPDTPDAPGERPWPVLLLTALGAWLAFWPLLGLVGLLFGGLLNEAVGPWLVGALVLAGSVGVLRRAGLTLFVEQLAVPGLLVGATLLAWGLFRDLPFALAAAGLGLIALAVAFGLPQAGLRLLLGIATCAALVLAGVSAGVSHWWDVAGQGRIWLGWQVALLVWLVWRRGLDRTAGRAHRLQHLVEPIGTGWLLALLAGLALSAGMSWLIGASLGVPGEGLELAGAQQGLRTDRTLMALGSALQAGLAAVWLAHRWPALRQPWCAGVAVVGLALAGLMPQLGAVLLVLAAVLVHGWAEAAPQRRRALRLAAAAALAAVWIVGAYYYQLDTPLLHKAGLLLAAGLVLGVLATWGWRSERRDALDAGSASAAEADAAVAVGADSGVPFGPARWLRFGAVASVTALLAVTNVGIVQKELLIRSGRPVYVELAPVDPRSLMQGDYMALGWRYGATLREQLSAQDATLGRQRRPLVRAQLDARGVARLERLAEPGGAVGADVLLIELTPSAGRGGGGWAVVSDAWFFREGEAERWQPARYGEFRVGADGKALLVGLADEQLQPLGR